MARTWKLLTAEIRSKALSVLQKLGNKGYVAIKLKAIIAAEKHGMKQACAVFGTTKASLISWIRRLDASPDELIVHKGRGPKRRLAESQEALIRDWIAQDSQLTIDRLRQKIEEELKVCLGRASVHRLMKRLCFSYITPRPQHHKQAPETLEVSKKKSDPTP